MVTLTSTLGRAKLIAVVPPEVTVRVAVEQASTFGWERYVGRTEHILGMKRFGASAPLKDLLKKFGFTPEHVVAMVERLVDRASGPR